MRITTYKTILDDDKLNKLIKVNSVNYQSDGLKTPFSIYKMMNEVFNMKNLAEEYLYMIAFDSKQKVLGIFEISHGTVNSSIVGSREIFIKALLCGGVCIVLIHNHPSGDTTPSEEDRRVTKKIDEAGKLMGVNLLDHLIVGDDYFSFRENGLL